MYIVYSKDNHHISNFFYNFLSFSTIDTHGIVYNLILIIQTIYKKYSPIINIENPLIQYCF